jgi:hypothetical protein
MKIMLKHTFILVLILFYSEIASQSQKEAMGTSTPSSFKTLYLHTDRKNYFEKDTIWFKAYYLHGQTHQPQSGLYSMYVELIDENSEMLNQMMWPIYNGMGKGYCVIPDSLEIGEYLLRAYTDLHKLYGEETFYHRYLNISKAFTPAEKVMKIQKKRIDVAFLPEGGSLLRNHINHIGIKAINSLGKAIEISGKILDNHDNEISNFETSYQGIGRFILIPEKGKSYRAVSDQFPGFEYRFNDIVDDGILIGFVRETEDEFHFLVNTNSKMFLGSIFCFAIMSRSNVVYQQKFILDTQNFIIKVKKGTIPGGINRFLLLDKQYKPISERLFFSDELYANQVNLKLDRESYATRSEVHLELTDDEHDRDFKNSNLSMAIVDEVALSNGKQNLDIRSWLLIDSELKGIIENPSDFFVDGPALKSKEKLDLLMLTHGWSRYLWNDIPDIEQQNEELKEAEGLVISGRVEQYFGKKGKSDTDVVLNIINNDFLSSLNTKTNDLGQFTFPDLYIVDTAFLFLEARNQKHKTTGEIKLDSLSNKSPEVTETFLPHQQSFADITTALQSKKYYQDKALMEYLLESGSIMLEEVIVEGVKEKDDGIDRIYSKPQNSFEITDVDLGFRNVFYYLQGRVAGLRVMGNRIEIRGPLSLTYTPPLFLLDGIPVDQRAIESIPMAQIDVVEVLKGTEAAIYGGRGAAGAIAIYTKSHEEMDEKFKYQPGLLYSVIKGYESYREFYSPKYTPISVDSEQPDHRITLYWNPEIITRDHKASVSFFTSDDLGRYIILVEGITETGKICLGTSELIVDRIIENP